MLVFSFAELDIDMPQLNGRTMDYVRAAIIDAAANYYKTHFGYWDYSDEDIFIHYVWDVNPVTHMVTIPDDAIIPDFIQTH